MGENGSVVVIVAFQEKFDPVFAFGAFLEGDVELGDKISLALCLKGFAHICANAGARPQQLIG